MISETLKRLDEADQAALRQAYDAAVRADVAATAEKHGLQCPKI